MKHGAKACLHLNGKAVGEVVACGESTSWCFGTFRPFDAFSEFAPIFGCWSLLMHSPEAGEVMSQEALDELSQTERDLDSLDARLLWESTDQWCQLLQLNIDGTLIEWKEI